MRVRNKSSSAQARGKYGSPQRLTVRLFIENYPMAKLKSERHHWWPVCVSRHWAGEDGKTGWLKTDGSTVRIPPARLGVIGNGHLIKLGRNDEDNRWSLCENTRRGAVTSAKVPTASRGGQYDSFPVDFTATAWGGGSMKEEHTRLFSHVTADKARIYRTILGVFASARRQFRLSLRPDEILLEGAWDNARPTPEELALALQQLTDWGNLESQPDTTRVSNLADFYRARFLYRLSLGGEAVESSLEVFSEAMKRRAELQSVALEDIATRLKALHLLVTEGRPDVIKVHEGLRDLVHRFEGLAENAQAFMSGVARGVDLQRSEATTVARYKKQLIDYINRFLGDLVRRSESIGQLIVALEPFMRSLLWEVAQREATDAAPGNEADTLDATTRHWQTWTERWKGLRGWFLSTGYEPSQSDHLRARARTAIPQLLSAIGAVNDRRSGRSDRSADFRALAYWFAACEDDSQTHRMARAAFGLNPARHFSLVPASDEAVSPNTSWANGPSLAIHPRLREYGEASPRGVLPRERDRSEERRTLANQFQQEAMQVEAARARLATGRTSKLSELGVLNREEFALFLNLLAEALSEQRRPDMVVERLTGDGLLKIKLEPLGVNTRAVIETENGWFSGQDHLLTISDA